MVSHLVDRLSFGTLGRVTYDEESSSWDFQRKTSQKNNLWLVSSRRIVEPIQAAPPNLVNKSHTSRKSNVRAVIAKEPSLGPAKGLLLGLEQLSEYVVETSAELDPSIANIAAFTYASPDVGNASTKVLPLLAHATGPSGELLQLTRIRHEWTQTGGSRPPVLLMPRFEPLNSVKWCDDEEACPILQICSSSLEHESGRFLAVRTQSGTNIFWPRWSTRELGAEAQNRSPAGAQGPLLRLQLTANRLFHIPIARTGDSIHIDVGFNPWDDEKFVILGETGCWSLFRMAHLASETPSYILLASSARRPGFDTVQELRLPCDDQWGRILWAANTRTLVACTRRGLSIFEATWRAQMVEAPTLGLKEGSELILDLKRDTANLGLVFVLTTTRLIWVRIAEQPNFRRYEAHNIAPTIILSWSHSWSSEFSLLSLAISPPRAHAPMSEAAEEGILEDYSIAMIYNRSSKLLEVYTTAFCARPFSGYLLADPFVILFDIDRSAPRNNQSAGCVNLIVGNIDSRPMDKDVRNEEAAVQAEPRYLQLLGLDARLGISESVLAYSAPWTKTLPHDSATSISGADYESQFDLLDNNADSVTEDLHQLDQIPDGDLSETGEQWTMHRTRNLQWLGAEIFREAKNDFNDTLPVRDLQTALQAARNHTQQLKPGVLPLSSVISRRLAIDDPEEASEVLDAFFSQADQGDSSLFESLLTPEMKSLLTGQSLSEVAPEVVYMELYNHLHQTWKRQCPKGISKWTRIALEQLVRYISLDLWLSSIGIRRIDMPDPTSSSNRIPSQQLAEVYAQESTQSQSRSLSRPASQTIPSQGSFEGYQPTGFLSTLADIPSRAPLSEPLSRVADEWEINVNPSTYDWQRARQVTKLRRTVATSASQFSQRNVSASQLSQAQNGVAAQRMKTSTLPSRSQSQTQTQSRRTHNQVPSSSQPGFPSQQSTTEIPTSQEDVPMGDDTQMTYPRTQDTLDTPWEPATQLSQMEEPQFSQASATQSSQLGSQRTGKGKEQKKKKRRLGF